MSDNERLVSPEELLAGGILMMLDGHPPVTKDDWSVLVNFFACNVDPGIAGVLCRLMKLIYEIPLTNDEVDDMSASKYPSTTKGAIVAQYTPGKYNLQLQCPDAPYDPDCQIHRAKGDGGLEAGCGTKARPWWDAKTNIKFPSVFAKVQDPINCTRNGCR